MVTSENGANYKNLSNIDSDSNDDDGEDDDDDDDDSKANMYGNHKN